ncbi:MAG TPA: leucyl aminopeptidase [Xanthobacteraceae bacterium]|nr:leucyl aminopeptidase [Xanthobacteraceae bacterium]
MADLKLGFGPFRAPSEGILVVFCDDSLNIGAATRKILGKVVDSLSKAAAAEHFTGKSGAVLDIVLPADLNVSRLTVIGTGKTNGLKSKDFLKLGGAAAGKLPRAGGDAMVVADLPDGPMSADAVADLAAGAKLRTYKFERYKTKQKDDEEKQGSVDLTIAVAHPPTATRSWRSREALADGVTLARDLINEPANVLYPEEFARRAARLRKLDVVVDVLDVRAMKRLGMGALLAVGQGSMHESRVVVMRWNGGKRGAPPVAFIGKGVCFDTGGVSIKQASGMEDMKGDMAGAACVVGLMHALAARHAKVNAVGAIGLVENMPDGNSYRPGDILKSMSGQTIEVINTDAEGRLVLADVLHYVNTKHKPKFMIDLATLTGAIMVALGHEHAGLFTNNDELSSRLLAAGEATGERVWRMPLAPEYDKLIDSKVADMKNTGGRHGGAITAAQLLARFVGKTPWAHLDIAGTAMASPQNEINKSWSSGWGVRLLDHLVAEHYEG